MNACVEPASWLTLAASLHFLQLPVTSWLARRCLGLPAELARLSRLNQRIVLIFMGAVSFLVVALAVLVIAFSERLLNDPLGRALCLVLGLFWFARATAQVWLYRVWPRQRRGGLIYVALLGLYGFVALSYLAAYGSSAACAALPSGEGDCCRDVGARRVGVRTSWEPLRTPFHGVENSARQVSPPDLPRAVMHRDELARQEFELAHVAGPGVQAQGFDQLGVQREGLTGEVHIHEVAKQRWDFSHTLAQRRKLQFQARAAPSESLRQGSTFAAVLTVARDHQADVRRCAGSVDTQGTPGRQHTPDAFLQRGAELAGVF